MLRLTWFVVFTALLLLSACGSKSSGNANDNSGADAGPDATIGICGDGIIEGAEECDDGTLNSDDDPDACRSTCRLAFCGDATIDTGETCDDGLNNSDIAPDACRTDCTPPFCGDGVRDLVLGEGCDDGDLKSHDGCSSGCTFEGPGWINSTGLFFPRIYHSLAHDSDRDRTVLFGGSNGVDLYDDTWEWDGTNWLDIRPLASPPRRSGAGLTYDSNQQRVLLFGGAGAVGRLDDTWAYDGTTWVELSPAQRPPPRYGHGIAFDAARSVTVLFGGFGEPTVTPPSAGTLNDTWEFDGTDWTEVFPVSSPEARGDYAMAYQPGAGVVIFGGHLRADDTVSENNDTFVFDGSTWGSRLTPAALSPRYSSSMAYNPSRDTVVLYGGLQCSPSIFCWPHNDTWEWDGVSWSLIDSGGAFNPTGLGTHTVSYHSVSGTLKFGGMSIPGTPLAVTANLVGASWAYRDVPLTPSHRQGASMVYDPLAGHVVLFGGLGGGSTRNSDTWAHDGLNWELLTPATSPPARYDSAMVYDGSRDRIVLFAGYGDFGYRDDIWEWDGADWIDATPGFGLPPRRALHAMAYDRARSRTVLFGGLETGGGNLFVYGDTWEWDGTSWTELASPTTPPPRFWHRLAYDPRRARVVLFGGVDENTMPLADTWEFDGTDWIETSPAAGSPTARAGMQMTWDADREVIFLFGGIDVNDGSLADTWEYDGASWVEIFTTAAPPPTFNAAIAYNASIRAIMFFGGAAQLEGDGGLRGGLWFHAWRSTWPDERCQSGVDDDSDGLVDCADPDCDASPLCP